MLMKTIIVISQSDIERVSKNKDMSKFFKKEKPTVLLKLNGNQESISIYPPSTGTGHFLVYTRSKMVENNDALGLKCGDQINVSFTCDDLDEAQGMFVALVQKRVQVSAHKTLQTAVDQKNGSIFYIIKTANSSTIDDDDDATDAEDNDSVAISSRVESSKKRKNK